MSFFHIFSYINMAIAGIAFVELVMDASNDRLKKK